MGGADLHAWARAMTHDTWLFGRGLDGARQTLWLGLGGGRTPHAAT